MRSTWTGKQRSAQKGLTFMLRFKFYLAGVRSHLQWGAKPRPVLERCLWSPHDKWVLWFGGGEGGKWGDQQQGEQ